VELAPGAADRESWRRLGVAVLLSAALHVWLAVELPVKPARNYGRHGAALEARIAPPEPASASESVGRKPEIRRVEAQPLPEARPALAEPKPAEPLPDAPSTAVVPETRFEPPLVEGPPGIEVPQVEDPEFYPSRLLDLYPKPVAEVELHYPPKAGSEDMSGTVTLLLLIDELGIVVEASVVEADPPGYFEDAAIEAFKSVLFTPGQREGRVVKSRLVVQVSFDAKTESLRR